MKLNALKCPNCGATISNTNNRDTFFCSYCGTKITATNENERAFRFINEAKLRKIDAKREKDIKRIETQGERTENSIKVLKTVGKGYLIYVGVVFLIVVIMLLAINVPSCVRRGQGEINPPISSISVERKNYNDVKTMFEEAGFTDVRVEDLGDAEEGTVNTVKEVAVGGNVEYNTGDYYSKDTSVIIRYYSKAKASASENTQSTDNTSVYTSSTGNDVSKSNASQTISTTYTSKMSESDAKVNFRAYAESQGFKVGIVNEVDATTVQAGDDWMVLMTGEKYGVKYNLTGTVTGDNDNYNVLYFNYTQQ